MKKLILVAIVCIIVAGLFAARPRGYTQMLINDQGDQLPGVENTSTTTHPDYVFWGYVTTRPTEITSTATHPSGTIRIFRFGNGTTVPYVSAAFFQFSAFATDWTGGETIRLHITHTPTGETMFWDLVIPDNATTALGHRQTINPFPDGIVAPPATAGPTEYDITVTSNPTGQPIFIDGVATGFVTPHVFTQEEGWDGLFTVVNPAYTWNPADYQVTDLAANMPVHFVGTFIPIIVTPNPAVNPTPANATVIERLFGSPAAPVTLMWEPDGLPAPEGYKLVWNGGAPMDLGLVTEYTTPDLGPGNYTWQIIAYAADITAPGKSTSTPVVTRVAAPSRSNNKALKGEAAGAVWSFEIVNLPEEPEYDYEEGESIVVGDITIVIIGGNGNNGGLVGFPTWNNPNFIPVFQQIFNLFGPGPWVIQFTTAAPWGAYYQGGQWHTVINDGGIIQMNIFPSKDLDVPIILGDLDPTLPVELSSFAATLTAQNFVALSWTSESETEMLGYRVYRSEMNDVNSSIMITPTMIPATNTSTTVTYKHEDHEVAFNTTYWYWLESVDYGTSHMHGPVSVTVTGNVVPELPVSTVMGNVYPNPFRMGNNANIAVNVKA
ncbi:MAG: hypothetical protein U1C33_01665, partial [Candidatus Cloacimonadaceae bacterium]|nr:hypothetical protein [Candidatus Cloacimonadaceae bacterium]